MTKTNLKQITNILPFDDKHILVGKLCARNCFLGNIKFRTVNTLSFVARIRIAAVPPVPSTVCVPLIVNNGSTNAHPGPWPAPMSVPSTLTPTLSFRKSSPETSAVPAATVCPPSGE